MARKHTDREERTEVGGGGHGGASGRWLVSYADFITLMMVVFMVLYAMARVDSAKFGQLKASLNSSSIGTPLTPLPVGGNPVNTAPTVPGPDPASHPGNPRPADPGTAVSAPPPMVVPPAQPDPSQQVPTPEPQTPKPAATPAPEPEPAPDPAPKPPDPLLGVQTEFQGTSAARAGSLSVELQDRGVVVSVLTSVLFLQGEAQLKPEGAALLDEISGKLRNTGMSVLVEGAPDASDKDAPWDLASRRASAVVNYLVTTHGLAPDRFTVIGYGKGAGVDGIVNVVVLRRNQ